MFRRAISDSAVWTVEPYNFAVFQTPAITKAAKSHADQKQEQHSNTEIENFCYALIFASRTKSEF